VGRDERRLLVGAVCGISLALATALLLGQPHGSLAVWSHYLAHDDWVQLRVLARKNIATTIQAIGALIAFYGLWRAYIRAKYDITVPAWIVWKAFRWEPSSGDYLASPRSAFGGKGDLDAPVYPQFVFNPKHRSRQQINQLARFVNERSKALGALDKQLRNLTAELRAAEFATADLEQKTLERIEAAIKALDDRLDRKQGLDLRVAIWGLLITFGGILWGLGT